MNKMLKLTLLAVTAVTIVSEYRVDAIINGTTANKGDFPYQAWIMLGDRFICGAVVIDTNWVLTAHHCIGNRDIDLITVVINDYQLYSLDDFPDYHWKGDELNRTCDFIDNHDNGFPISSKNDVSLCKLNLPVPEEFVIPMASNKDSVSDYAKGWHCVISGWGLVGIDVQNNIGYVRLSLQYTTGEVLGHKECKQKWEDFYGLHPFNHVNPQFNCIHNETSGACFGDSGGPMMCNGLLVGITHAGESYCNTYLPGIYMNIPHFYGWINAKIGANKPPKQPREITSEPADGYEYLGNVELDPAESDETTSHSGKTKNKN